MRQKLESEGYLIVEDVFDVESLEPMRRLIEETAQTEMDAVLGACENDAERVEKIGKLVDERPHAEHDPRTRAVIVGNMGSLETRLSKVFWPLYQSEGLLAVLGEVFQSDRLFFHMPPAFRCIIPGNKYCAVPAHQDYMYNQHMVSQSPGVLDFVTVWVPFTDIDDECGGVGVYEGSGESDTLDFSQGNIWIDRTPTDEFSLRHCKMRMGDVLIFNKYLIHESQPNLSDHRRYSLDCRAFGHHTKSSKHHLDVERGVIIPPGTESACTCP